jgi:hypothetical protein
MRISINHATNLELIFAGICFSLLDAGESGDPKLTCLYNRFPLVISNRTGGVCLRCRGYTEICKYFLTKDASWLIKKSTHLPMEVEGARGPPEKAVAVF